MQTVAAKAAAPPPTLLEIARFFAWAGMTSWGGIYAILPKVEAELDRRGWLPVAEFRQVLAAATLVPGPTFLSLAGLVGYRVGGAPGAGVALLCLMLPPTLLVAAAMLALTPELLKGPLAPVTRAVSIAVGGILIGNAYKLASQARRSHWGFAILALTAAAVLLGAPVPLVVVGAIVLGRLTLREVGR